MSLAETGVRTTPVHRRRVKVPSKGDQPRGIREQQKKGKKGRVGSNEQTSTKWPADLAHKRTTKLISGNKIKTK